MARAGVICEFNPFHNGHKFLLEKIKRDYHSDVVCIMSGNFVQRGDIAVTNKYARTETALQNGADMVIELPTVYATASAKTFAESGVRIAAAINCDRLYFGAENSISDLTELSELLENRPINDMIHSSMKSGEYFPKALSMAIGEKNAQIIKQPNNILALEYIKACRKFDVLPMAIPRKGVSHNDDHIVGNIASASKIRSMIEKNENYRNLTPMKIDRPCSIKALEPAILYRLKTITPYELRQIADVSEGLENRIIEVSKQYNSLSEIYTAIKTKRYTMARIRRIITAAFLDISSEMQSTLVPYLRILGIKTGKEEMLKSAKLPLIVKTKADHDLLDNYAKNIFRVDLRAAEAMNIASGTAPINEFSRGIIKI